MDQVRGNVGQVETLIGRIEDANAIGAEGREDNLAVGGQSCTSELVVEAQVRGSVDQVETLLGKIENARTISVVGREDNLAVGSQGCTA